MLCGVIRKRRNRQQRRKGKSDSSFGGVSGLRGWYMAKYWLFWRKWSETRFLSGHPNIVNHALGLCQLELLRERARRAVPSSAFSLDFLIGKSRV
jgi:hypothetical protein